MHSRQGSLSLLSRAALKSLMQIPEKRRAPVINGALSLALIAEYRKRSVGKSASLIRELLYTGCCFKFRHFSAHCAQQRRREENGRSLATGWLGLDFVSDGARMRLRVLSLLLCYGQALLCPGPDVDEHALSMPWAWFWQLNSIGCWILAVGCRRGSGFMS